MQNIPTKNTGDSYTSAEFNQSNDELKNAITDSGQTLSGSDSFQISQAASVNAAGADYYDDSGVADAYVLSKPGTSSLRSPPAYFEGMTIRFRPTNANTGGSTVNVAAVGVVSILKEDGVSALSPGDLTTANDVECRYDIGAGAFLLKAGSPDATKTSKGILFLGDQRIILSNNGVDPNNDIDFTVGRFTFDDGTGQAISNSYTKQLDATFVAGNNQGMLDTGTKAIDTWYHCFAIYNPTNGLRDYLASTSATSPTLPAGYTKKRRIGAIRTDGSNNIIPFFQYEKWFQYPDRNFEIDITTPGNTGTLAVITTPLGIPTIAKLHVGFVANATRYLLVSSPDETNVAVTANSPYTLYSNSGERFATEIDVKTDTSSQIRYRSDGAAAVVRFLVHLLAYEDYTLED
jgi:hypothetical protein